MKKSYEQIYTSLRTITSPPQIESKQSEPVVLYLCLYAPVLSY